MKNNVKLLLLALSLALVSCTNNNTSKTSSNEEVSISSTSESNVTSKTSKTSLTPITFDFGTMSLPSGNVTSNNSISSEDNSISIDEFDVALKLAAANDSEYSKVGLETYTLRKDYYTVSNYEMTSYTNQVVVYRGNTRQTYYNDHSKIIKSSFVEQRLYEDGILYQIRKYDNDFSNSAYKIKATSDGAAYYLNIGQCFVAYQAIGLFAQNYDGLMFMGQVDEYGSYRGTYLYVDVDSMDQYNNVFIAAVDILIDENFFLKDFFYTEGYYDAYYVDDIDSIRRHGPAQSNGTSYFTHMTSTSTSKKIKCTELPLSIEDNFIHNISFSENDITVYISELPEDEKYINLIDYIVGEPECGETKGAPVNNLVFTSSDEEVAKVGDIYYLDILKPGYVEIEVRDSATGAKASSPLYVYIEE